VRCAVPEGLKLQTAESAPGRPLVEQALLKIVSDAAERQGYLIAPPASDVAAGFPDLLLAHPQRPRPLWALWVLASGHELNHTQQAWMQAMVHSTVVEALLVRPGDYRELVELLGGRR
jgi:hypothetical protein